MHQVSLSFFAPAINLPGTTYNKGLKKENLEIRKGKPEGYTVNWEDYKSMFYSCCKLILANKNCLNLSGTEQYRLVAVEKVDSVNPDKRVENASGEIGQETVNVSERMKDGTHSRAAQEMINGQMKDPPLRVGSKERSVS